MNDLRFALRQLLLKSCFAAVAVWERAQRFPRLRLLLSGVCHYTRTIRPSLTFNSHSA